MNTLRADCGKCFGLCCVALPFSASADFAVNKDAGTPCANLRADFGCGIHARLREGGFSGCTVYDCFGAGQQVSQVTFGGTDWRQAPDTARQMFDVFPVVRQLHELLWYLTEAHWTPPARSTTGSAVGSRPSSNSPGSHPTPCGIWTSARTGRKWGPCSRAPANSCARARGGRGRTAGART